MIKLTKIDGSTFYLNARFVEQVTATPDTQIILSNGKRILVKESLEQFIDFMKNNSLVKTDI